MDQLLQKLEDSAQEVLPKDVRGVLAPEWFTNHIIERKPVKKFVNINEQTRFDQL